MPIYGTCKECGRETIDYGCASCASKKARDSKDRESLMWACWDKLDEVPDEVLTSDAFLAAVKAHNLDDLCEVLGVKDE